VNHLVRYAWLLVLAAGIATSIGAYAWLSDQSALSIQNEISYRSQAKLDAIRAIFQQHFDTAMAIGAFVQGEMGAHQSVQEIEAQGFAHAMLDTHPDELVAIAILPPQDLGEAQFIRRDGEDRFDPPLDRQRLHRLAPADMPDIQLLQNRERHWLTRLSTSVVSESGTSYAISDWNTAAMIDIAIAGTPRAGLDIEVGLIKNSQFIGIYRHRSRLRKADETEGSLTWRRGFSLNGIDFEVRTRAVPSALWQLAPTGPVWMLLLGLVLSLLLAYLTYNRSRHGEQLRQDVVERTLEVEGEQQKLASVIDHANETVLITDEAGFIERINPAASDVFGYAPDEWGSLSIHDLVPRRTFASRMCSGILRSWPAIVMVSWEGGGSLRPGARTDLFSPARSL
jgi:PAS domain-containing protein